MEEADSHIQANLEDSVVKEALKSGVDLREYSAQVNNFVQPNHKDRCNLFDSLEQINFANDFKQAMILQRMADFLANTCMLTL